MLGQRQSQRPPSTRQQAFQSLDADLHQRRGLDIRQFLIIAQHDGLALARLPDRQREAIVLCPYQELSNIEAAGLMEISIEALESLLSRGRRALRQALADHRPGAEGA